MKIAEYFAEFSIRPDRNSIRRVDSELKKLENKLRGFGKNSTIKLKLSGFNVDQPALRLALGNSLDIASKSVAFEISKFVVNDRNLQAALLRAARRLPPLPPGPNPHPLPPRPGPYPPDSRRGSGAASGFIGGGVARLYSPALALAFGGYGLAQLNKRNQQVVSAQLQSSAVVQQAGGTVEQGAESFQYLRKEANRIGFNYLDASQDYNKLISGLTGSGVSVKESQKVFSGFAELARVNKLDKTTQNRLFRALSQVAGKGKLQAEELTGQISEALPGGTALFAQAYQRQLKDTGKGKGDLTGQAAIQALLADMKKGIVNSGILTYAGSTASDKAQTGLTLAQTASQAEQQRYQNSVNDLAVVASDAGIEEGFARIFRTLAAGLDESNGLVRLLSEGFNDATKWADDLLLFPQSFIRALEGRDSLVADWLGEGKTTELRADWKEIQASLESIFSMKSPEWAVSLKDVAQQLKDLIAAAGGISKKYRETKEVAQQIQQDSIDEYGGVTGQVIGLAKANYFTLSSALGLGEEGIGYGLKKALNTIPFARHTPVSGLVESAADYLSTPNDTVAKYYINRDKNLGVNTDAMYGSTPEGYRAYKADEEQALARDVFRQNTQSLYDPFKVSPPSSIEAGLGVYQTPDDIVSQNRDAAMAQADQAPTVNNVTNQFDITISVDATLAGIEVEAQANAMAQAFSTSLTGAFEQAQVNFPTKG